MLYILFDLELSRPLGQATPILKDLVYSSALDPFWSSAIQAAGAGNPIIKDLVYLNALSPFWSSAFQAAGAGHSNP